MNGTVKTIMIVAGAFCLVAPGMAGRPMRKGGPRMKKKTTQTIGAAALLAGLLL